MTNYNVTFTTRNGQEHVYKINAQGIDHAVKKTRAQSKREGLGYIRIKYLEYPAYLSHSICPNNSSHMVSPSPQGLPYCYFCETYALPTRSTFINCVDPQGYAYGTM